MSKHTLFILVCALVLVLALSGCTSEIPLTTADGTTYGVTAVTIADEYAERVPSEGTKFLLITIQGTDSQLDDMQSIFFSTDSKAQVSDGASESVCSLIVYAPRSADKLDVVLMFQVPDSFADSFTLSGSGFEPVALSVDKE